MITFVTGNLLDAKTEALVNTVNTVGVMGKGIALQFKNRFPHNYKVYRDACKEGEFSIGEILTVFDGDLLNRQYILNFPTKAHWKAPSKIEYIKTGLKALKIELEKHAIKSVAIPPLGCGNGGLDWEEVKKIMLDELSTLDIDIFIYEPIVDIKELLQKKNTTKKIKLTPARAMLLSLMFEYESAGEESSLFVANKLAYFLQRKGEKLSLNFEAHIYGPYAVQLNHVLLHLNGTYLSGMEQNMSKPFDSLQLNYSKLPEIEKYLDTHLSHDQRRRVKEVKKLIHRYESTFSLELLATVDFIKDNNKVESSTDVMKSLSLWSKRKSKLFKLEQVQMALNHLEKYTSFQNADLN